MAFAILSRFLNQGHERSVAAKKNIISMVLLKGSSIAINLLLVPLTIRYVNAETYGVWLTFSSIVAWISFFDIGFTNSLRNRFAEAKAKGDIYLSRIYVSTTYFFVSIIFIVLLILLLIGNNFIPWSKILNVSSDMSYQLLELGIVVFLYFCLQFIFRIINTILIADQRPAESSLWDLIGQLISLITIVVLTKISNGSLIYLALALGIAPTLVALFANIFYFKGRYSIVAPSLKFVRTSFVSDIMQVGFKFFIIQIAGLIIYQSANLIISHYYNPTEVTNYNIAYRYFGILNMVFSSILLAPFWSATTEAYARNDFKWIVDSVNKYRRIWVLFCAAGALMLLLSNWVYEFWIGKGVVNISFAISLSSYIFFCAAMFAGIHISVLNGINALKIQFISCIFTPFIFIGSSMLLAGYFKFGVSSIIIASIIANMNGFIIAPIQYYKIFKKKQTGIWTI